MDVRLICKRLLATCDLPKTGRDAVLLTFDDGPHPEGTPAVLDVLRRYDVRGLFFVVGSRVHRAPQLLRRIVDDGHIIGNHSFAHPLDHQFGMFRYYRDVEQCQTVIERFTGVKPTLFRPPLGHLSPASILVPRLAGLTTVLWTVDSDDWRLKASHEAALAAERLITRLSRRPLHDIVLLHDEKTYTAELLEIVLPVLASRQVDLVPGIPSRVRAA